MLTSTGANVPRPAGMSYSVVAALIEPRSGIARTPDVNHFISTRALSSRKKIRDVARPTHLCDADPLSSLSTMRLKVSSGESIEK